MDAAVATITVNAANGPIQRVNLTNASLSSVSLNIQNKDTIPWLSGQGVTVIIENNMTADSATWNETNFTDRFYNRTPEILKNKTTILYMVGYGSDDVSGEMSAANNSRWYITSQTFGTL